MSLLTRPVPPRRWFVALTTSILVPVLPVPVDVLNVMDVGLVLLPLVWIIGMPMCVFYALSRLVVVVWKALVVFTTIRPLLDMNSCVNPLVAAAPLALPILITTTILGPPVFGPLIPR